MIVAVEATWVQHAPTGIGWYVHQLLSAYARMDTGHRVVLLHATPEWTGPDWGDDFTPVPYGIAGRKLPGLACRLGRVLRQNRVDLYHATFTTDVPPRPPVPVVTTVHDLYPLYHGGRCRPVAAALFRAMLRWTVRGTTQFVTNSRFTASQLTGLPGVDPERVTPVWLAPVPADEVDEPTEGNPIALCLGAIEPRKGQLVLARAWAMLARTRSDLPRLVFAGPDRGDGPRLQHLLDDPALQGNARWLGYVDRAERARLLRRATMVLVPSRFEGFGLAVLEGMQAGAAVLCSSIPPFREIAGDAAHLVHPNTPSAWAGAIAHLLDHPEVQHHLSTQAPTHAAKFTWQETARRTLECYRRALR